MYYTCFILIQPFPSCEYETLEYNFRISNLQTNKTHTEKLLVLLMANESTFTIGVVGNISFHGGVKIELDIKNEADELLFMTTIHNISKLF